MPPDEQLTARQIGVLLVSVLIIAICGLVYELIIGTLSSYLLGSSVTHFSITIGLFLFAMGIGSWASKLVRRNELRAFMLVEVVIGLVGGVSAAVLYGAYSLTPVFYPVLVVLIMIIGGCIGIEIPLLTRLSSGHGPLRDVLANVFTFDYLGALIGSLLFPFVLLPYLGLMRTSFVMGLLNLLVALVVVVYFRDRLGRPHRAVAGTCVAAGLLVCGLVGSARITGVFESQMYDDEIVHAEQSKYQRIIVTRWREDLRLYLDGNLQFSLADEHRYHESLVHPAMALCPTHDRILVLGGGDGMAVREVLKYDDVREVVLVDIDPAITRLARTLKPIRDANGGSLDDARVKVINTDAMLYLEKHAEPFQVIIVDLPDPNSESLSKLYSNAFYRLIAKRLTGDGVLASQATSPYFAREAFWSIVHTAQSADLEVNPYHVYVPSFGDWGFFVAAPRKLDLDVVKWEVPTRYLSAEVFQAARVFDADINELDTKISTLDNPVVLHLYEHGGRRWQ